MPFACEEFGSPLRSVRASIVRVDMHCSIRAPDLAPSPLGEWIKDMRDVIVRVNFYSLGKCDNPGESCRIPDNCHHYFARLNGDPLPLLGFSSLRRPDPLVICREMEPGLTQCYLVMLRPVFLLLKDLEEFKEKFCSAGLVSFRQKMWDPTKISKGKPKFVLEVVIDRGKV
jgi:hypothetical protein